MLKITKLILALGLLVNLTHQAESQSKSSKPKDIKEKILTAEQIAQYYLPSVVMIVCDDGKGLFTQGSGFFIKQGVILTNYHVIDGKRRGKVKVSSEDDEAKEWWIDKILFSDYKNDLALISIKKTDKTKTPILGLSATEKIKIGEIIYVLSNPKGLAGTISQGIVSSRVRKTKDIELLQIDAPISSGSSGGAVLNSRGEVIGIATASLKDGQNLNFAIPLSQIKSFLNEYDKVLVKNEYAFFEPTLQNGWSDWEDFSEWKRVEVTPKQEKKLESDSKQETQKLQVSPQPQVKPSLEETTSWLTNKIEGTSSFYDGITTKYSKLRFKGCEMQMIVTSKYRGYVGTDTYLVNLNQLAQVNNGENLNGNYSIILNFSQPFSVEKVFTGSYVTKEMEKTETATIETNNSSNSDRIAKAFERLRELCFKPTKEAF